MKSKILLSFVLIFCLFICGCDADVPLEDTEEYQAGFADGYDAGYEACLNDIQEDYENNQNSEYAPVELEDIYPIIYYVDTKETPLNIRVDPEQNSEIIGQIPQGENVEIWEIVDNFGAVLYGDIEGWINLAYCKPGENPNPTAEVSDTVYVTDTGSKYHKESCSYLKSKNPMSLDEAKRRGYEPCSRCY